MRIAHVVVLVAAVGAAGAAIAGAPPELEPAWDVLLVERTSSLRGPRGRIHVHVVNRRDKAHDVEVVSVHATEPDEGSDRLTVRIALSDDGVWIEGAGAWYTGDAKGAPLFDRARGPFFDRKTGLSLTVDADETTCVAWSDPAAECDGDCYWIACWARDRGVVRLGGAFAPLGDEYVAADPSCVADGVAPAVVALAADRDQVVVCTEDEPWEWRAPGATCRGLDRATLRWERLAPGHVEASSLVHTEPTSVIDRDGRVSICADDESDCPVIQIPAGMRLHHAAASDDGTLAAAVLFDDDAAGAIASYDVSSGKQLARIELPVDVLGATLRYAGDALVVERIGTTELRDARTLKRRGEVPFETSTPPLKVKGRTWAFASLDEVAFQDVKSGRVKRRVALPDSPRTPGARAWLTRAGDDVIVVYSPLLAADDRGGVVIIGDSGVVTASSSPGRCPSSSGDASPGSES